MNKLLKFTAYKLPIEKLAAAENEVYQALNYNLNTFYQKDDVQNAIKHSLEKIKPLLKQGNDLSYYEWVRYTTYDLAEVIYGTQPKQTDCRMLGAGIVLAAISIHSHQVEPNPASEVLASTWQLDQRRLV